MLFEWRKFVTAIVLYKHLNICYFTVFWWARWFVRKYAVSVWIKTRVLKWMWSLEPQISSPFEEIPVTPWNVIESLFHAVSSSVINEIESSLTFRRPLWIPGLPWAHLKANRCSYDREITFIERTNLSSSRQYDFLKFMIWNFSVKWSTVREIGK